MYINIDKKYYLIIMGANISEIMIFYIMKKIEAEEYEESQRQSKLIKDKSHDLEIINPLKNYDDIK